jgi:4-amino-4-deoxy-L-arabinose transferase-like glycosyltransferase
MEFFRKHGHKIVVVLILLVSFWLRWDYITNVDVKPVSDMEDYDKRAMTLLHEHTFQTGETHGATYRPPGYVVFLAGLYGLFEHKYRMVYAVQTVLSVAALYAIYLLGRQLWNRNVGLLALFLSALYVPFIGYSGVLLSETLFNALFLFAIVAFLHGMKTERGLWFAISGVLFGLSALTRSIALLVPVILVIWMVIKEWKLRFPRAVWLRVLLLFVMMGLTISPWTVRNYAEQKHLVVVDTISGLNLLIGNNEYANGFYNEKLFATKGYQAAYKEGKNDAEVDAIMKTYAKDWILANPGTFVSLTWDRFKMYLAAQKDWVGELYHWEKIRWFSPDFIEKYQRYLMAFGLVAVVVAFVTSVRSRSALLPVFVGGYFLAALSAFYVQARYRLPAMPFILLLSAFALWQMRSNWKALVACGVATFALAQWLANVAAEFDV